MLHAVMDELHSTAPRLCMFNAGRLKKKQSMRPTNKNTWRRDEETALEETVKLKPPSDSSATNKGERVTALATDFSVAPLNNLSPLISR